MPSDNNVTLLTSTTVTTAAVNGPDVMTQVGTPRRGLNAAIYYKSVSAPTTGCVMTVKQQKSSDGTTYVDAVIATPITLTTAAQQGVMDMPVWAGIDYPHIRFVVTPSPTTGSPTGIFQINLTAARPG